MPHRARSPWRIAPSTLFLVATVALSAWVRVRGLGFGLPAVYNPDEVAILSRALAFAKGDLNPHNFLYPTFFFYLLFVWIGAAFVLGRVSGTVPSLDAFQTRFFVDPSDVYLAGRALGVACGVAGVLATWWLARRLFGRRVGLVAALFLAVAPTAVRDAHYIKHDVPVTLAIVVAMGLIARLWPLAPSPLGPSPARPAETTFHPGGWRRWDLVLAASACGVACSTHYYAVFLAVPLALAVWRGSGGASPADRARALALAALVTTVSFLALSPFLVVEPWRAWQDIVANRQIVLDRSGAGQGLYFASAGVYVQMLWREAMGWPVVLLALVGLWLLVRLSWRVAVWFIAFPALFLAFISNTVPAGRYLNPVLPFVAVLASLGVSELAARLAPRRRLVAVVLLAGASALPGFHGSRYVGWFFRQDDTRALAQRYVEAHVPAGATVLLQPYSVQLVQSRASLIEALTARLGDPALASTKFALRLKLDPWPAPAYRTLYLGEGGLDADKIYVGYDEFARGDGDAVFRRLGVRYVILKRYNTENSVMLPLLTALARAARPMMAFSPYRPDADAATRAATEPFQHNTDTPLSRALERPGPTIEIWAIP